MTSQEAWQQQQKVMEDYRTRQPALLINKRRRSEAEIFQEIGIWQLPHDKTLGYIRLHPQDFLVEEKLTDGKVIKLTPIAYGQEPIVKRDDKTNTLYAEMIKIGIPTEIAVKRLADSLNFKANKIGYAGLKDADAITAQLISFSGIALVPKDIIKQKISNVHLKNFYYDKGSVSIGNLSANIFTIAIRTKELVDKAKFSIKIQQIAKYGVLNYFQSQRFGGLRLSSHLLGQAILQGDYELCIKIYLFKENPDDIPLITNLRREAKKAFPNWLKIEQIFAELPYTFFNELKIIKYLIDQPDNFLGALINLKEQTTLWVYAYASWLFNKYLSLYAKDRGVTGEKFSLLLSDQVSDQKIYQEFLEEDKTTDFIKHLRPFKFIQLKRRQVPGRIFPEELDYKIFDRGVVLKFSLPKASYATTLLANLFEICQGLPIPDWVKTEEVDTLALLGQGSIAELKQIFKDCWYSKLEQIINLENPV